MVSASSDGNEGAPQKDSKTGKTISKLRISGDINYLKDTTSPTTPTKSESIDDYQTILSPQENEKDAVNVFEVLGGSQKDFEKVTFHIYGTLIIYKCYLLGSKKQKTQKEKEVEKEPKSSSRA